MEALDGALQSMSPFDLSIFHSLLEYARPQSLDGQPWSEHCLRHPVRPRVKPLGTLKAMPSDSHSRRLAVFAVAVN
jgi:hypothetical protein